MKTLNQYIQEQLIINKNYRDAGLSPKSFDELRKIIEDRYDKLGAGTKQNPIDFNDIDVSNLDSFCNDNDKGIFEKTKFKYIDISSWDVSNVTNMTRMFCWCKELKSVGDISKWDVSSVTDMWYMFFFCESFNQDISKWNVSSVTNMGHMFWCCKSFNQDISGWDVSSVTDMKYMFVGCKKFNQNISKWDVSKVNNMSYMFYNCVSFNQDISDWNVSNVIEMDDIFYDCPMKEEYKPKFK